MEKYSEEMFVKLNKDTEKLLHFLAECKFAGGNLDNTKLDINIIIKKIANYQFIVDILRKENKELDEKNKVLENKIKELTKME